MSQLKDIINLVVPILCWQIEWKKNTQMKSDIKYHHFFVL